MNWTEKDVQRHYERLKQPPQEQVAIMARAAKIHEPRQSMNKTEAAYAQQLELERMAGMIDWWAFEPIKLRLANRTYYTPDFLVLKQLHCVDDTDLRGYSIEFREVKGHWEEDARVKVKVAAEQFRHFRFIAVQKIKMRDGGGWKVEEF